MQKADFWINKLNLQQHPEGGYFRRTYESRQTIDTKHGKRFLSTCIYYLITGENNSRFHRLRSTEIWFYHFGSPVEIYMINEQGKLIKTRLGKEKQLSLQAIINSQSWFAAEVKEKNSFCLVSCTVSPGFDYKDFELADTKKLINKYPQHKELIKRINEK